MQWLLFLALVAQADNLGTGYSQAVSHADSMYRRERYVEALAGYRAAYVLLPDEPGPQVGIGWALLKMGDYAAAESAFKAVLAAYPEQAAALEGVRLLPAPYRFKFTAIGTGNPRPTGVVGAFAEYNNRHNTTATFGFQYVTRDTAWRGFNTAFVLYRRLHHPWSVRFDLYTLAAFNAVRYWHVILAPGIGYRLGDTDLRLTAIGWDKLEVAGLQVDAARTLSGRLTVHAAPAFNVSDSGFGWFVPADLRYQPLPWLAGRLSVGFGSISRYVDMSVPTIYNQPERLHASVRLGADVDVRRRYRFSPFVVLESDSNRKLAPYLSLAVSVKL